MIRLIYPAAFGLALFAGQTLSTDYAQERALRIEVESTFAMKTTDFSMERDGEPVEARGGRGGQGSSETRTVVMIDTVLEHGDGTPTKVRREFEAVSAKTVSEGRDGEEMENERECPLHEVTLELVLADGDVVAEVVEGSEPDDEALLEGHLLALGLDALLPEDDVEADDDWELDGEMLMRACGLDLDQALFPRPPRQERGEGGEGRRGGGQRGQRGTRGGGASVTGFFENGDWEANATLEADTEEWEGLVCQVITIEAECTGELPEQERGGGGGGGRGGGGGGAFLLSTPVIPENSFEVELEGKLLFSVDEGRPVYFELEGTVMTDSIREMNRGEMSMVMSTTREGTFKHVVNLTVGGSDDEDK